VFAGISLKGQNADSRPLHPEAGGM
jgi:hypothetical protein